MVEVQAISLTIEKDCLEALEWIESNGLLADACITDPPYELRFLGKDWDGSGISFDVETWKAVYRVLKPGAYLAAFGATRLYHRMAVAIEDAGFEIKDSLCWLHGQGFPKNRKTQLKPGWEPIVLARKAGPSIMNVDDARVPLGDGETKDTFAGTKGPNNALFGPQKTNEMVKTTEGRWPANVVTDGSEAVDGEFPVTKAAGGTYDKSQKGGVIFPARGGLTHNIGGEGPTSRFYYQAKPSPTEREAGLSHLPKVKGRHNTHTTVKSTELMRWLVRLLVPKGGMVIDPFLGSGTTAIAAVMEERRVCGIEREAEYMAIARARIDWWTAQCRVRPGCSVAEILGDMPKVVERGERQLNLL